MADDGTFKRGDSTSYDAVAAAYARHIERLAGPLATALVRLASIEPGDRVLDVGCGTGLGTRAIATRLGAAGSVLGIDLSAGMLDEARRAAASTATTTFRQMDAERLELDDGSFDVITSLCAVLHFGDIDAALSEMRRVLRPGGTVVVSYGAGRPPRGMGLVAHGFRRARARLTGRTVFAPGAILAAVESLPPCEGPVLTTWAGRDPASALRAALRRVGFLEVSSCWVGQDTRVATGADFWDAQAAIVTEARRRLDTAGDQALALRARCVDEWQAVVSDGGSLVYPYGAVFVRATAPGRPL